MNERVKKLFQSFNWVLGNPRAAYRALHSSMGEQRAYDLISQWKEASLPTAGSSAGNPLTDYFNNHTTGNGIWKWRHYFDMYHRHFEKFRGKEVHIVEVGVYSGGSMDMWRDYFGPRCKVYGVDIQEECKLYENENVKIFIGDQADRTFWKKLRESVPRIDILIDDGGHQAEQQIVTLEETLPYISAGGVFICEDVHRTAHPFGDYMAALQRSLNHQDFITKTPLTSAGSTWQQSIHSIHQYPFAYVIEKNQTPVEHLVAPRHGTKWEPFL